MSYINHRKPYGSDTKLYTRVGEKEAGFVLGDDREEIRCIAQVAISHWSQ